MTFADSLVVHESEVRASGLLLLLIVLLAAETLTEGRPGGWFSRRQVVNLAPVLLGSLAARALIPVLSVAASVKVEERASGILPTLDLPFAFKVVVALLALDCAVYWQHRAVQKAPFLWRLHGVHHSDLRVDVTTGVRFHSLEIAASMVFKVALVVLLGPPAVAVVVFELLLSAASLLIHTDRTLSAGFASAVRCVWVTPAMHRIHPSTRPDDSSSNFGFHLSVWDRLFGSYQPARNRDPEIGFP